MQIVILDKDAANSLKYKLPSPEICKRATSVGIFCRDREHVVIIKHRQGDEDRVKSLLLGNFDHVTEPLTLNFDYSSLDHKDVIIRASTLSYEFNDTLDTIMRERGKETAMRP